MKKNLAILVTMAFVIGMGFNALACSTCGCADKKGEGDKQCSSRKFLDVAAANNGIMKCEKTGDYFKVCPQTGKRIKVDEETLTAIKKGGKSFFCSKSGKCYKMCPKSGKPIEVKAQSSCGSKKGCGK